MSNSSDELRIEMQVRTAPPKVVFTVKPDPTSGFTAQAVDDAIFIEGDTEEVLESNAHDAIRCHFDQSDRSDHVEFRYESDEAQPA